MFCICIDKYIPLVYIGDIHTYIHEESHVRHFLRGTPLFNCFFPDLDGDLRRIDLGID